MDNARLFRMIIERGFNGGDLSVADEMCAPTLIEHEYLAPTAPRPDILKTQIRQARAEVTNLHLTIEDLVVEGDKVWARMLGKGQAVDRFALLHQAGALPPRPK